SRWTSAAMIEAALGFGGNIGDPVARFGTALQALSRHARITVATRSSVYATQPWGNTDQPEFANMAAIIRTTMPAAELLSFCLRIETEAGRKRLEPWGRARSISTSSPMAMPPSWRRA